MRVLPPETERQRLCALLAELSQAIESLLDSGLTAASDATRQTLDVSFQAASQMRLLRLGATLRVATEELGRYVRQDETFSRKRFSFFLHRAWMLSHGMEKALRETNAQQWMKLAGQPVGESLEALEVVALGVSKRVVPNAFCAFEFRLRVVGGSTTSCSPQTSPATPLVWSCVFPLKSDTDVMAEAFLHLQQKQKFKGADFLEKKIIRIEKARLVHEASLSRLSLTEESQVTLLAPFADWDQFETWDIDRAIERVQTHGTTPFDLEIEMQEEVILPIWNVGEEVERLRELLIDIAIETPDATFYVPIGLGAEHHVLRDTFADWRRKRKTPPPLYGILHYEMCRLMLQPLSLLTPEGPEPLNLSNKATGAAALLKSLSL